MKKSLIFIFSLLIAGSLFGQDEYNLYKPTIIPPNPDIASLLKYLEAPVSPATGIASSNIPIYSINEGKISYNINLSYNASGIRVNETASSVGLGWSINTPKIIRTVRGIADDAGGGFINQTNYTVEAVKTISENMTGDISNPNVYDSEMKEVQRLIKRDGLDLESDLYSIFLPSGENIQFMFNQNRSQQNPKGEIVTFPKSFVKIVPGFNNDRITSWQVIDVDGTVYTFGGGNYVHKNESFHIGDDLPTLNGDLFYNSYSSSWDLTKIESTNNNKLEFIYENNLEYENCNFANQIRKIDVHDEGSPSSTVIHANTNETVTYLKSITGSFGTVEYTWSSREDHIGKKLHDIKIKDINGKEIKTVGFNYSYTNGTSPSSMIYCDKVLYKNGANGEILEQISKRMFLNTVTFKKGDEELNKYEFEYDPETLPHRFSLAQDWWGFYNGKNDNTNLAYNPYSDFWDINTSYRHIDQNKSQAGILKKITYPTGGYTEFEYENNRGIFPHKGMLFHLNNIIPSNVNTELFYFDADSDWSFNQNENCYEYPLLEFETNSDVLNYFKKPDYNLYIRLFLEMQINGICNSPSEDLPLDYECYSFYKIYDENDELVEGGSGYVVHGKKRIIEVPIGTISGISESPKKYKLELKGYSGTGNGNQREKFDPNTEIVHFNLNWFVYNPDLVKKAGAFEYEIPIGGLRIKEIKHFNPDSNNPNGIIKRYSYKDENEFESARYNVWIDNVQMINHYPYVNSLNNFPLQTNGGNVLVYENFTEKLIDFNNPSVEDENMSTVSKNIYHEGAKSDGCHFFQESNYQSRSTPCFQHPLNGKTFQINYGEKKLTETTFTANGDVPVIDFDLKNVTGVDYNTRLLVKDLGFWGDGFCSVNCIDYIGTPNFLPFEQYFYYNISQFYDEQVKEVETTTYLDNEFIEKTTSQFDTFYTFLPTETTTTNSLGETLKTGYQYPHNLAGQRPWMSTLVADNRIAEPVVVKTKNLTLDKPLSIQETVYEKDSTTVNYILPKYIFAKTGSETLNYSPSGEDIRITYDKYDNKGNLLQYTLANGTPVSIIWGYNGQYPIAKVEGISYQEIQNHVGTIISKSNQDDDNCTGTNNECNEAQLRKALNDFRSLSIFNGPTAKNVLITSYTYDPLIGVTSITQPNRQIEYYQYDNAGRLKLIMDQNGKVLKEIEYNYYNQQP